MSLRKTLILGALLVGVLFYILWVEIPGEAERAKRDVVFNELSKEEIETIEIQRAGESYTLKNTAPKSSSKEEVKGPAATQHDPDFFKKWELSDVKGSELDSAALNGLLSALSDFRSGSALPKNEISEDLAVYGLKEPEVSVKVNAGNRELAVSFGKENEYLSKRYAKITGYQPVQESSQPSSDIFLMASGLYAATNKSKLDFRKKTPLEYLDSNVKSIELIEKNGKLKLESTGDFAWRIVEPLSLKAGNAPISELHREIRNLRAAEFIDGDHLNLADYGLDNPALTLKINFKETVKTNPIEAQLGVLKTTKDGKTEEKTYFSVTGKPSVFKLSDNPVTRIFKPVDAFREKKQFKFLPEEVEQLHFTKGDSPLVLTKSGNDWKVNDKNADETFVRQLLKDLSDLEAKDFPQASEDFGFGNPILKVNVRLREKTPPNPGAQESPASEKPLSPNERVLVIGRQDPQSKNYYATVDDQGEQFLVGEDVLKRITPKEEALVKVETSSSASSASSES